MVPGSPLLALRIGAQSHALEPGRSYLLGSAVECDLRIADAEPRHARLEVDSDGARLTDLGSGSGVLHNELRVAEPVPLALGDRIAVAGELIVVVPDLGDAAFIPIPELRQAASERRIAQVRIAAAALRHHDETFSELMAREMRRAPWLLTSLLVHLLLLLLVFVLVPPQERGGRSVATLGIDLASSAPEGNGVPNAPDVVAEPAEDSDLSDPEFHDPEPEPEPEPTYREPEPRQPVENPTLLPPSNPRLSRLGRGRNIGDVEDGGAGTGNFARQVAELQENGLDIVFVFDSTGSMTHTINDTKSTIIEMLDVLRSLVPGARVGLVTYRDRDRREEYLVRHVPLDIDYWRATNFVQYVLAEGGGDRPEDVFAGLREAFHQDWRPMARRVVVLAGDAPTHAQDFSQLQRAVRHFASNRRSFVHTLVTNPDRTIEETFEQFERIAELGNGVCEKLHNHERVLQRVLTLAFGSEFERDIASVVQSVREERGRVDVRSLYTARQGGEPLERALLQRPVPMSLWNAVIRRPRQGTAESLIRLLESPQTPSHTRNAAAAALQQILDLPLPPIDAQADVPPTPGVVLRLRAQAQRLPE